MTRLVNHNPPAIQIPRGYLTLREIAARMHVSYHTAHKWVKQGLLKAGNMPGSKRIIVRAQAFERFCRSRCDRRATWRLTE